MLGMGDANEGLVERGVEPEDDCCNTGTKGAEFVDKNGPPNLEDVLAHLASSALGAREGEGEGKGSSGSSSGVLSGHQGSNGVGVEASSATSTTTRTTTGTTGMATNTDGPVAPTLASLSFSDPRVSDEKVQVQQGPGQGNADEMHSVALSDVRAKLAEMSAADETRAFVQQWASQTSGQERRNHQPAAGDYGNMYQRLSPQHVGNGAAGNGGSSLTPDQQQILMQHILIQQHKQRQLQQEQLQRQQLEQHRVAATIASMRPQQTTQLPINHVDTSHLHRGNMMHMQRPVNATMNMTMNASLPGGFGAAQGHLSQPRAPGYHTQSQPIANGALNGRMYTQSNGINYQSGIHTTNSYAYGNVNPSHNYNNGANYNLVQQAPPGGLQNTDSLYAQPDSQRSVQMQSDVLLGMQRQQNGYMNGRPASVGQHNVHEQLISLARQGMLTQNMLDSLARNGMNQAQIRQLIQLARMENCSMQPSGTSGPYGGMTGTTRIPYSQHRVPPEGKVPIQPHQMDASYYMRDYAQGKPQIPVLPGHKGATGGFVGDRTNNSVQTLQHIGRTLSQLGISVEAAVNAGLLGGLSAPDVRIVAEAYTTGIEARANAHSSHVSGASQGIGQIASRNGRSEYHIPKVDSAPTIEKMGNLSAPNPSSPSGSVGGYSTASLPVNVFENPSPESFTVPLIDDETEQNIEQIIADDPPQELSKPVDEEWLKSKVETNALAFDASQYGFFGGVNEESIGAIDGDSESLEAPKSDINEDLEPKVLDEIEVRDLSCLMF